MKTTPLNKVRLLTADDLPDLFDVQIISETAESRPITDTLQSSIVVDSAVAAKAMCLPPMFHDYFVVETA